MHLLAEPGCGCNNLDKSVVARDEVYHKESGPRVVRQKLYDIEIYMPLAYAGRFSAEKLVAIGIESLYAYMIGYIVDYTTAGLYYEDTFSSRAFVEQRWKLLCLIIISIV